MVQDRYNPHLPAHEHAREQWRREWGSYTLDQLSASLGSIPFNKHLRQLTKSRPESLLTGMALLVQGMTVEEQDANEAALLKATARGRDRSWWDKPTSLILLDSAQDFAACLRDALEGDFVSMMNFTYMSFRFADMAAKDRGFKKHIGASGLFG